MHVNSACWTRRQGHEHNGWRQVDKWNDLNNGHWMLHAIHLSLVSLSEIKTRITALLQEDIYYLICNEASQIVRAVFGKRANYLVNCKIRNQQVNRCRWSRTSHSLLSFLLLAKSHLESRFVRKEPWFSLIQGATTALQQLPIAFIAIRTKTSEVTGHLH